MGPKAESYIIIRKWEFGMYKEKLIVMKDKL